MRPTMLAKLVGPVTHVAAGGALWLLLWMLGSPPLPAFIGILAVGVSHEIGDGDFKQANGGPANGLRDVAYFLPIPVLAILGHLWRLL